MGLKEAGLRGSLRSVSTGVGAIPDSVASRPNDDSTQQRDGTEGLEIEAKDNWPSIGCRISENTSGVTMAYLEETNEELIQSVDISGLSSGESFTFEDVNLLEGEKYFIRLDAEGDEYTLGFYDEPGGYPFESDAVDITGRVNDDGNVDTDRPRSINDVGNTGFD